MKIIKALIIILLLNFAGICQDFVLSPSFFVTNGNYSSNRNSLSYSPFLTLNYNYDFFLVVGYDRTKVTGTDWNYEQQTISIKPVIYSYPHMFKSSFITINGSFKYLPKLTKSYNYSENSSIINLEYKYFYNQYAFNLETSYLNMMSHSYESNSDSILKSKTNLIQFSLEFSQMFSDLFTYSVRPFLHKYTDNDWSYFLTVKSKYLISDNFTLKNIFSIGNRKFYFDSDLLSIFNQNDIQQYLISVQGDYKLYKNTFLNLVYLYTKFQNYNVNYIVFGIKTDFIL